MLYLTPPYFKFNLKNIALLASLLLFFVVPDQHTEKFEDIIWTERDILYFKTQVSEMMNHALDSYMTYAYPADEISPVTCDIKKTFDMWNGNYSVTLIDSLDTLALMEKYDKYEKYSILFINNVNFNSNVNVSLFEANIRMLGGLISNHYVAKKLKKNKLAMLWYSKEFLNLAIIFADKLMQCFVIPGKIPFSVFNLKHGVMDTSNTSTISTAAIGTLILEFGSMTRLTGNQTYYKSVMDALDILWSKKSIYNLQGETLNVVSGEWTNKMGSLAGNIDSYYEYLLKSYIAFNDVSFYEKFHLHYVSIMKYLNVPPNFYRAYINKPEHLYNEYDALVAFWPGLQILYGDTKSAYKNFIKLESIVRKYNFLPENYKNDNLSYKKYYLRPEFYESNFYLYELTKSKTFLDVAVKAMVNLNKFTRVKCGFSSLFRIDKFPIYINKMDSYFLAETLKYIYLVFEKASFTKPILTWDEFIYNTEAHFIPIYTPHSQCPRNVTRLHFKHINLCCTTNLAYFNWVYKENELNSEEVFSAIIIRATFAEIMDHMLKTYSSLSDYMDHTNIQILPLYLDKLGFLVKKIDNDTYEIYETPGIIINNFNSQHFFLQLYQINMKFQKKYLLNIKVKNVDVIANRSLFGKIIKLGHVIEGNPHFIYKNYLCNTDNYSYSNNNIIVVKRGKCTFYEKAINAQKLGAIAIIVYDTHIPESNEFVSMLLPQVPAQQKTDDIKIPLVYVQGNEARKLLSVLVNEIDKNMKIENLN